MPLLPWSLVHPQLQHACFGLPQNCHVLLYTVNIFSSLACLPVYNAILCTSVNVHIHAQADVYILHIPGKNNQVADMLSHIDFAHVKHLVPALSISPFALFMPSVPPPLLIAWSVSLTGLWCSSLSHRYFCTAKIGSPNLGIFLIPLVKSFVLTIQRNPQEGL